MKYLLLLLFPLQVMAGFTPFAGTTVSTTITGKGYLLSSNGSADTQLAACGDGALMFWDDTEGTGIKCSGTGSGAGALSFGPDVSATWTNVLHFNKGEGSNANSGIFMYGSGGGTVESYVYDSGADNILYIGTNSGTSQPIYMLTNGSNRITIDSDGSVAINDTGGNGGNVPHNCTRRETNSATYVDSVSCSAGEMATGGGCTAHASGTYDISYIIPSGTSPPTGYSCRANNVSATIDVYAICCDY